MAVDTSLASLFLHVTRTVPNLIPILLSALFARFLEPALQLHHGILARFRRAPAQLRAAGRMRGLLCSLVFTLSDQGGACSLPL